MNGLTRRAAILHSACLLAVTASLARRHAVAAAPPVAAALASFEQLEAALGGRIGVAAIDTGSGARLSHRADERFAMCSTFKWVLAAAVLAQHDRDSGVLRRRLNYGHTDIVAHSPVTLQYLAAGSLPVAVLCRAAVEQSDNTAANMLLAFIGGPTALTSYLRANGDAITRLDRIEPGMSSNLPGDPRDTTTPDAMAGTMQALLLGSALSARSRALLLGWMKNCRTGRGRLRAGVPATWMAADKTGTGDNGAVNDNALFWPPARAPILVAVYLSESTASMDALDTAHARIGTLVATAFAAAANRRMPAATSPHP